MARAVQQDHLIDGDAIANLGWRQGSFLGPKLAKLACDYAPRKAPADRADLLVVSSHDCDIVNFSLEKEPVVEVLGARRVDAGKIDGPFAGGVDPIRSAGVSLGLDPNHQAAVIARSPLRNIVQRPHRYSLVETARCERVVQLIRRGFGPAP